MSVSGSPASGGEVSLTKVMVCNWLLLGVLTGLAWLGYSGFHARSVFIGGAIANLSFLFLKRDLLRLLAGPLEAVTAGQVPVGSHLRTAYWPVHRAVGHRTCRHGRSKKYLLDKVVQG